MRVQYRSGMVPARNHMMPSEEASRSPRRLRWGPWACGAAVVVTVIAVWPVTTRSGINYQVSTRRLTLFEKTVDFVSRDLQGWRIAREVVGDTADPETRLTRIFAWAVAHVQPTPPGFPIVDDHVLHTIIRGYGTPDQQAEVLALLANYSGCPATGMHLQVPGSRAGPTTMMPAFGSLGR